MDDFNASSASSSMGGLPTVEVKSKFDAEFRRFSLDGSAYRSFDEFRALVARLHGLGGDGASADDFRISYVDPKDNDLLPINNTDNYQVSLDFGVKRRQFCFYIDRFDGFIDDANEWNLYLEATLRK